MSHADFSALSKALNDSLNVGQLLNKRQKEAEDFATVLKKCLTCSFIECYVNLRS